MIAIIVYVALAYNDKHDVVRMLKPIEALTTRT